MQSENIEINRWHNRQHSSQNALHIQYGTPSAWLRRSHQTNSTTIADDSRDHYRTIRAAAVFDLKSPIHALSLNCTYTLVSWVTHRNFKIIMVSTTDAGAWIRTARAMGARAWWLCEPGPLFEYVPIKHPTPQEDAEAQAPARGAGNYDRDLLIADLKSGTMTQQAIADKYGITRSMVSAINRGRRRKDRGPAGPARVRTRIVIDPGIVPLVVTDICSGTMTKDMIAQKHNIPVQAVTTIVGKHGLVGKLPRGYYAAQMSIKKQNISG